MHFAATFKPGNEISIIALKMTVDRMWGGRPLLPENGDQFMPV